MLTILNRREIFHTSDMKQQAEVRTLLEQEGIDCQVRTINRKSPSPLSAGSRAYTGSAGEKQELAYDYTIFVAREMEEKVRAILKMRLGK
ncbi:MAG: hypothetical protein ACOYA8_00925 [Clostridium sp.]|jgi:hypothetical protein